MPTIYVENKPYEVPEGQNVLHACLSLGFDIPYFCWHPAMHSVGACRQCAVKQFKDADDTQGKIVMSCMVPAQEGTRISIDDPQAVRFRKACIEWLMLNHPHDCPVCDEGGECHLQDMTELCGHVYRRTRFKKRSYRNQYLGPFLTHEMNRCIQCYRCVRFYIDYAGGRDLDIFGWHDQVYFGRHADGVLKNKFSGNLVEVCPTGVFDDKTFGRHFTRKWDLQTAPSVCVHCGLGCNTIPGEHRGLLRRIRNRYNGDVNGYFLCDRGRFGYEFVNSPRRVTSALTRDSDGRFVPMWSGAVLTRIGRIVKESQRVVGIGSARASLESNFALRTLVGPENFYIGMTEAEVQLLARMTDILQKGPVRSASMNDVSLADAVLILGEDVSNVAPMLELALRRSILRKPSAIAKALHIALWNDSAVRTALQTERGPLFIATTHGTDLDASATATYHAAPQDIARLGFAVANKLDPRSPAVENLPAEADALASRIAEQLAGSERPLVLSGSGCGSSAVIEAAANVAFALRAGNEHTRICFAVPWCNSMGLGLVSHKSIEAVIRAIRPIESTTIIILEDDVYRHLDTAQADDLLHAANQVIVIDHVHHATMDKAAYVLPAATFAESTGTLVNNEGRAQRFFKVLNPSGEVRDSWRWIGDIMQASGKSDVPPWPVYDDIVTSLSQEMQALASVSRVAPSANFRIQDQLVPRRRRRSSGRTAEGTNVSVHEPPTPTDPDSPLSFSMEGYGEQPPSPLIPEFWAPGWNSVQAVAKYQDGVAGPLRGGNPGIRLIEPPEAPSLGYFAHVPPAFAKREGCLLVVPGYHIFGSEELSILAPAVAELVAKPVIAVGPEDIASLVVDKDGLVEVVFSQISHHLPVRLTPGIPPGLAVVPMGLPGVQWNGLPVWKRLLRK
jgi:NADH-quinone oxidoreductase subunit G